MLARPRIMENMPVNWPDVLLGHEAHQDGIRKRQNDRATQAEDGQEDERPLDVAHEEPQDTAAKEHDQPYAHDEETPVFVGEVSAHQRRHDIRHPHQHRREERPICVLDPRV